MKDRLTGSRGGKHFPLLLEDGRRFATPSSLSSTVLSFPATSFPFLAISSVHSPFPSPRYSRSHFLRPFDAVPLYFSRTAGRRGEADATQLPRKTVKTFPTDEAVSIIVGILRLEGEEPWVMSFVVPLRFPCRSPRLFIPDWDRAG